MSHVAGFTFSLWKVKLVGWLGIVFFSFCFCMSWQADQRDVSPWFIPFILLSIPVLLQAGTIYCDKRAIRFKNALGTFEMEWDEIQRIEEGQSNFVFINGDRRLCVPLPTWWSGKNRGKFLCAFDTLLEERDLEVSSSFLVDFQFSKNTRISERSKTKKSKTR